MNLHQVEKGGTSAPPVKSISLGSIDPEALRPLVEQVVRVAIERLEAVKGDLDPDRLAYSEPEAAALLGLNTHQLRDERGRGRITASLVVGRRVRYLRSDLIAYLMRERTDG